MHRTRVKPGCLTPLRMPHARVVWLDNNCAELLLVAGRDVPGGRSLSIVRLMDELFEVEDELKYRIEVVGMDGVLSLSGPPKGVERRSNFSDFMKRSHKEERLDEQYSLQ